MIEAVLRHQLATRKRALVSSQQIVDMHRARVDVLQIRSFEREDTGIGTIHFRVFTDEVRGVISSVEILTVPSANIHFVVTGGAIEQPLVIDLTIEITERTGKVLFDKTIVAGVSTRFTRRYLRPNDSRRAQPISR